MRFYSPNLTDGRATFMEISQVLAAVNQIRQTYMKRMHRRMGIILAYELMCLFFFCLCRSKNSEFLWPSVVVYVTFALFGIAVFSFFQIKNTRILKHSVAGLLQTEYRFFASRGLRWNIPDSFSGWLELHKDYRLRVNEENSNLISGQENFERDSDPLLRA